MQGENSKIHTQKSKISKVINKSQRLQDEKSMYNILMAGWKNLIKSKVAKNGYRERLKLKKEGKKKKMAAVFQKRSALPSKYDLLNSLGGRKVL